MGIVASAQVELRWPQQQHVPAGGVYRVYANDGAGGAVDYGSPIDPAGGIDAWGDLEGLAGFGLGTLGGGALGYGDNGLGIGQGVLGGGPMGIGAEELVFRTPDLADGAWSFGVVGYDPAGNGSTPASDEQSVNVAGTPRAPSENPTPTAWDDGTSTLTLSIALSPDDEAA